MPVAIKQLKDFNEENDKDLVPKFVITVKKSSLQNDEIAHQIDNLVP
jgi:hypothetical protein